MDILRPPRQSNIRILLYSFFIISTVVCPSTHLLNPHQSNLLSKRQVPSLENSLLNPLSPNPPGSSRASNLNPTNLTPSTPSEPAVNSSSTPPPTANNPTSTGKDKDSLLIPLLGSTLNIPTSSPHPWTNSSSTTPTNSTAAPPPASANISTTAPPPSNKSTISTSPTNSTSVLAPQTPEPTSNHSSPSHPATNQRPAQSSESREKSTFGSTTVKLLAITGGVVAGLFLLWTVIRKWKFRPSKRFANKLDDYDDHMFEPRPPSFSEKRPNEYPSYPSQNLPLRSASPGLYPSHLSEITHTPGNIPRQNLFSQGPSPYPVHRLSNASVTKPLPIFESNYRISLGLGSEMSHSYPPLDHPQPNAH